MSSEPGRAGEPPAANGIAEVDAALGRPRGARRRERRFALSAGVVLGALALAAGGLTAANAVQGPRVLRGDVNASAAIERSGQRLVLQLDQPVAALDADDVELTPATPFEVESEGSTVTLRFTSPLAYDAEYVVGIPDVRGLATGATGGLEWSFSTPDPVVHVLQRAGAAGAAGQGAEGDRIVRRDLDGVEPVVAFQADRIQDFALAGDSIAAATLDADGAADLRLVARDGSGDSRIALPGVGSIDELHGSGASGLFGWLYSSRSGEQPVVTRMLQVYDTTDTSGVARTVPGLDGEPIEVRDWLFVPGTSSMVVQAADDSILLIDPLSDAPPTPLGSHAELRGFIAGTTRLVVADPQQGSTIDLATGEQSPLELPQRELPPGAVPGALLALGPDSYVELVRTAGDAVTGEGQSAVLDLVTADGARELWRPAAAGTSVGAICLSPNGRVVAVEATSAEGVPDGYPGLPGSSATTTVFVDVASGDASRGIPGFRVDWCA
jgi:hypothetical protein